MALGNMKTTLIIIGLFILLVISTFDSWRHSENIINKAEERCAIYLKAGEENVALKIEAKNRQAVINLFVSELQKCKTMKDLDKVLEAINVKRIK